MFYRKLLVSAVVLLATGGFFAPQFAPQIVHAQFDFINVTEGQAMRVTVLPKYPKAFEKVNVTVEDFSRDINSLSISWSQGGRVVARGTGLKTFSFTTGALGTVSDITVSVGETTQTIPVRPTEVDLLWQTSSFVPPFYKGKSLHSNQDPIIVVAEPFFLSTQGVRVNPTTLIYKWKQNGTPVPEASGYGLKTFTVRPSVLSKPVDIEVEVSSANGGTTGIGRTTISETTPKILVYENSPLYGLQMEKSLGGKNFLFEDRAEATFTAIPFFFSATRANDASINYTWTQNGTKTAQKSNEVVFRAPNEGSGSASIRVDAKHATNYLQGAGASFTIQFMTPESANAGESAAAIDVFKNFTAIFGTKLAMAQGGQLEYEPLVPLPIGTGQVTVDDGKIRNFSDYVIGMFRFLIGAAAALAVIMIIIGGLEYMTTDAISGKSEGRERINQAIIGLLLAIGSWLILNTVDPDILKTTIDTDSTTTGTPTELMEGSGSSN